MNFAQKVRAALANQDLNSNDLYLAIDWHKPRKEMPAKLRVLEKSGQIASKGKLLIDGKLIKVWSLTDVGRNVKTPRTVYRPLNHMDGHCPLIEKYTRAGL